ELTAVPQLHLGAHRLPAVQGGLPPLPGRSLHRPHHSARLGRPGQSEHREADRLTLVPFAPITERPGLFAMTRRIVAITVAIVLAALGAAGGLFLILTADKRAQDALEDGVTVAVAKSPISIGTTGARVRSEDLIKLVRFPKANVPDDALTDFGPAYDK